MSLILAKVLGQLILLLLHLIPWRWIGARLGLPCHDYAYRNPYTRRCRRCRRQEDVYCNAWQLHDPRAGWWEEMFPGDPGHRCSKRKET